MPANRAADMNGVIHPPRNLVQRQAARITYVAWALTLLFAGLCLVLASLNRLEPIRFFEEYIIPTMLGAATMTTIGILVVRNRPLNSVGWILIFGGLSLAWHAAVGQYVRYTVVTQPRALPGTTLLSWLTFWTWIPVMGILVFFLPLYFPDGRLPSLRWRPVLWVGVIAIVLMSLLLAISPGPFDASLPEVDNPYALPLSPQAEQALTSATVLFTLPALAGAVAAPIARFRRSQPIERQQLKWFAFAAVMIVIALVAPLIIHYPDFTQETLLSAVLLSFAFPFLPVAIGIAILRYRLYGIDTLINRALVYGTLTALLALVYFGCILVAQWFLQVVSASRSNLAIVFSTLATVFLFSPLRRRVQLFIDQKFYRHKYDTGQVIAEFSETVRHEVDLDCLVGALLSAVDTAMKPDMLSLVLIPTPTNDTPLPPKQPDGDHQPAQ